MYYYQSNHSKVETIPLSALPKDTTSELACLSSHYPFNVGRQVEKLGIPTFKIFWSNSTRESNPGLPTVRQTLSLLLQPWVIFWLQTTKLRLGLG